MDFKTLHDAIPYAKGGKEKILRMSPYPNVTLAMPGRHAKQTDPVGGDFVVMVSDDIYTITDHQFTHSDIFDDVQARFPNDEIMRPYLEVIQGADPTKFADLPAPKHVLHPFTFLYAVQCLAIAEHRRYHKYEKQFGGRYLPFRFAAGIAEGLWRANDASALQRKGRPGVEMLEKQNGIPKLTMELMGAEQ